MPCLVAMARKVVIVHETQEVNELAVENVSRTEEVFIQAGDIVKGGQQDRVLAVDLDRPRALGAHPRGRLLRRARALDGAGRRAESGLHHLGADRRPKS